jgi:sugar lactone lactonase YvrE
MKRMCRMVVSLCALASLSAPTVASANPGDVFVSDESAGGGFGAILKLGPAGGEATPIASGPPFDEPAGMIFMDPRTLLVADDDAPAIFTVDTVTGARSVFASGPPLSGPTSVDQAPDGTIYVTDTGTPRAIYRIDPNTGAISLLSSGPTITAPRGLAVTRQGFAYFAEQGDGIMRVDLASGAVTPVAVGGPLLTGANRIALSPDEKTLYIANRVFMGGTVTKLDLATGVATKLADETGPGGIAQLSTGSLLVSDTTEDVIRKFGPTGGPGAVFSSDPDFVFAFEIVVEPQLCGGRLPTVAGTDAPEVLTGTPFPDVIDGQGGADQISGLGAKDVLCGGGGKDRILGGPGNDQLLGQGGKDKLIAGKGRRDSCNGGKGKDRVRGCEKTRKVP